MSYLYKGERVEPMIVPWVSVITYFITPLHNIKLVIEYFYFIAL